jgi:hypothetical protein
VSPGFAAELRSSRANNFIGILPCLNYNICTSQEKLRKTDQPPRPEEAQPHCVSELDYEEKDRVSNFCCWLSFVAVRDGCAG